MGAIPCLSTNHPLEVLASHSVIGAFLVLTFQYVTLRAILVRGMLIETEISKRAERSYFLLLVTHELEMTRFFWCLTSDKCSPLHCSGVCIIKYLISLKSRKAFIMLLLVGADPTSKRLRG